MAEEIITEDLTQAEIEELDKLAYTHKRYLTPKEIAAYVLVNFGQKNLTQYVSAFKEFFMIQFLKLNTTAYANINLFASIYDAVDDTISGLIIDRTRTRWGRIRPFFIIPLPLWVVGGFMMFTAPDINSTQKIIWAAVAVVIYGLGMSYFGAWNLMIYNITPNTDERNNLITVTKFVELFGTWIPSLVPVFVTILPKLNSNITMKGIYSGFSYFMLVLASGFTIFGFFNMRERVPLMSREEMNETSILASIKNILTNKPLFAIILSDFFNRFKSVGGSSEQYFWLNNTGSLMNQTICGLFTGIPNYVMVPLAAKMVKKMGARTTAIIAGVFGGVVYMITFFIGYHPFGQTFNDHKIFNLIWVIFALTICGLPNKIIQVCNPILCAEALDYMEWKHGLRNEALVTTVQGYFGKLADSVTGWLSGMVLTWVNYIPLTDSFGNAIPQTDPTMLSGIWAIFCILPAIARGFYGLSFIIYPIHGKLQQQIIVELADKRADRIAEQSAKENASK
ncbi:MAG: MFS transporter [Acetobacter sp.]|nr:MFS transporter [Bacteroides sp.]MCM1341442.1 MFS transporter [Acetobacter sp.]MCM1433394.1 MFS transporter [Clostridiales bacterium]